MRIRIEDRVKEFIRDFPGTDRRVIGEHIERLSEHPGATGNIKRQDTAQRIVLMRIIYIIKCSFIIHSVVDYEHQHWIAL